MSGLLHTAIVATAGLLAGAVNGVAGGGSLISFSALLALGYPPVAANVTSAVAAVPGYGGALIGYREELGDQGGRIRRLSVVTVAGTVCGSLLLLVSPAEYFVAAVPVLVLLSAVALGAQPVITRAFRSDSNDGGRYGLLVGHFAVCVYGGYFAAGLGVVMLAVLGLFIKADLHRLNALKGALSLIVGVVAALCFALLGPVAWGTVVAMSVTGLIGGLGGVALARRIKPQALRWGISGLGVLLSIALFVR